MAGAKKPSPAVQENLYLLYSFIAAKMIFFSDLSQMEEKPPVPLKEKTRISIDTSKLALEINSVVDKLFPAKPKP